MADVVNAATIASATWDKVMKKSMIALLLLVAGLAGCAVVPYGPPIGVGVVVSPGGYGHNHGGHGHDRGYRGYRGR